MPNESLLQRVTDMRRCIAEGRGTNAETMMALLKETETTLTAQATADTKAAEAGAEATKCLLKSLSYSELEAMKVIVARVPDEGGMIVASKVADEVGMTRSVIVNAFRKMESAGAIQSQSLGMKGTHIKPLWPDWRKPFLAA